MANNANPLSNITVEQIENEYRAGRITAEERQLLLRAKAKAIQSLVTDNADSDNIAMQYLKEALNEGQKGWDNLKEALSHPDQGGTSGDAVKDYLTGVGAELYYGGLAIWGTAQIILAPLNALGTVAGKRVENLALAAGVSPGWAKFLGLVADVGTGIIPIGGTARLGAKGVQAIGGVRKGAKAATEVVETGAKAAKEGAEAAVEVLTKEEATLQHALVEGLKADGIADADKVVEAAAKAAGKPVARTARSEDLKRAIAIDKMKAHEAGKPWTNKKLKQEIAKRSPTLTGEITEDARALRNLATGVRMGKVAPEIFLRTAQEVMTGTKMEERVRITSDMAAMLTEWAPELMAKGDIYGAVIKFADDISVLRSGEVRQMMERAREIFKQIDNNRGSFTAEMVENAWYGLREGYVNLLMPMSWAPSIIGNFVAIKNMYAERIAGGLFSADRAAGYVMQEPWYLAKGMALAMGDAARAFKQAYSQIDMATMAKILGTDKATIRSMSREELFTKLQATGIPISSILNMSNRLDFIPGEVSGRAGKIVRFFGSTTMGVDNFTKVLIQRGAEYAWAIRDAVHKNVADRGAHVAALMSPMGPKPAEMLAEARQLALTGTFQNDLGRIGQAFQRGVEKSKIGWLWFPFIKTPIDLTKYAWNRTPGLQLISTSLYQDILAGGTRADAAIGRLTWSNLMANFNYEMAKAGFITGGPPADPELRGSWEATHEPYSYFDGENFFPYQNMDPETSPAGFMADLATAAPHINQYSFQQSALAITLSTMRNFSDNLWWPSVTKIVDGINKLARGEEASATFRDFLMGPVTTIASGGPLGSRTARILDPVRREVREHWVDRWKSQTPGWSTEAPAARDGYGDKIIPPRAVGTPWFGYFHPIVPRVKEQTDDWIKLEGDRLGVNVPTFELSIGGGKTPKDDLSLVEEGDQVAVPINGVQKERWQVIYKNYLRKGDDEEGGIENKLRSNEQYVSGSDAYKRALFEAELRVAKQKAGEALQIEDGELGLKVMANKGLRGIQMLPPEEQPEAREELSTDMTLWWSERAENLDELTKYGVLQEDR